DGGEFKAAAGCRADRAIEGPARAINGDGQCVDDRRAQKTLPPATCKRIRRVGNEEEQTHITDSREDDKIGRKHQSLPGRCRDSSARSPSSDETMSGSQDDNPTAPAISRIQTAKR